MEWYEQPEPTILTPMPYVDYEEFALWKLEPVNYSIFHIATVNHLICTIMDQQLNASPAQIGMKRAGHREQKIKRRKSS